MIPQSFQVPNLYIDRLLPLLTDPEIRVLFYMTRQIYGWEKSRARNQEQISIRQIVHGKLVDDRLVDGGAGIGKTAVRKAINSLKTHKIIIEVTAGKPYTPTEWRLQQDASAIDWAALMSRKPRKPTRSMTANWGHETTLVEEPNKGHETTPVDQLGSRDDPKLGSRDDPKLGSRDDPSSYIEEVLERQTRKKEEERKTDSLSSVRPASSPGQSELIEKLTSAGIAINGNGDAISDWPDLYEWTDILAAIDYMEKKRETTQIHNPVGYIGSTLANQLAEGKIQPAGTTAAYSHDADFYSPAPTSAEPVEADGDDMAIAWRQVCDELSDSRLDYSAIIDAQPEHWQIAGVGRDAEWLNNRVARSAQRRLRTMGYDVTVEFVSMETA